MSSEFSKHIEILEAAAGGKLSDTFQAANGGDMETFYELYEAGLVTCTNPGQISGVAEMDAFCFPKITVAGREQLAAWKRAEKESTIGWQFLRLARKATLWVGLGLGVAATKLIELGIDRLFPNNP